MPSPTSWKDRWELELGDSRDLLPALAARVAPIDVFLHDALHTYASQMREYRTVWPHLRPGGVLVSDDVGNPAFVEFARSVGAEPHLVVGPDARDRRRPAPQALAGGAPEMRILLVSHYQRPHVGGIEFVVDELARALSARGHDVAVVSSDAGGGRGELPAAPYRSIRVPAFNGLEARFGVPYPIFSPALLTVLRREIARADVVHAQGWLYQGTVAAFALARRRRVPRVLSEHVGHVPYSSPLLDRAETLAEATVGRFSARSADALVLLNAHVREQVAARAPSVPVVAIPNGTDLERCRPPEPGERQRLRAQLGGMAGRACCSPAARSRRRDSTWRSRWLGSAMTTSTWSSQGPTSFRRGRPRARSCSARSRRSGSRRSIAPRMRSSCRHGRARACRSRRRKRWRARCRS